MLNEFVCNRIYGAIKPQVHGIRLTVQGLKIILTILLILSKENEKVFLFNCTIYNFALALCVRGES